MVHHDKPNTLSSLRKLVQAIDTRYWERHGEVSGETRTAESSRNKSKPKSDQSKSDNKSGKGSSSKQKNSGSTQGTTSETKEPASNLSLKLDKDGKLMPQECQRRLDNNLCLFCGNPRHIAKDCSKASVAKARAAKAEQEKSVSTSGSEPKKD